MARTRTKTILAELGMLLCGIIWGGGFVVMKNSLDYLPVNWLLGIRFILSALVLSAIFFRRLKAANRQTIIGGAIAGVVLYVATYAQTIGLTITTAGSNAFLTAAYVVFVPFFNWIFTKKKPGAHAVIAAVLCMSGVGVIALNTGLSVNAGDALTLLCAVFFALHIIVVARYCGRGADALALTCVQFAVEGVLAIAVAALSEPVPAVSTLFSGNVLFAMGYMVLLGTVYSYLMQNIGISLVPASHASLLLSTESLFGFLAGIIFLHEPFTLRFLLGALLIMAAVVLSELGGLRAGKRKAPGQT